MMKAIYFRRLIGAIFSPFPSRSRRRSTTVRNALRYRPRLEVLEDRSFPATALFSGGMFELANVNVAAQVSVSTPGTTGDNVQITLIGDTFTAGTGVSGNGSFTITNSNKTLKIDTSSIHVDTFKIDGGAILFNSLVNLNATALNSTGGNASIVLNGQGNSRQLAGVSLNGATISGAAGVTITGSGADNGSEAYGVLLALNSYVEASGTGAVTITGTGGNGTDFNVGVYITGGSGIGAFGGGVTITGSGAGTGDSDGVLMYNAGTISATSTGNVAIYGSANGVNFSNVGVEINYATITSDSGSVTVVGTGSGDGDSGQGVLMSAGLIASNSSGDIHITGDARPATGNFYDQGVSITDSQSSVTAVSGNIFITGYAGGSGGDAGVSITSSSTVQGSGGAVTIAGTGSASGSGPGVNIAASVDVLSSTGITIAGVGGGDPGANGVALSSTTVESTGAIAITGTATHGIGVQASGATISSTGGVTVTGTGGGSAFGEKGVSISGDTLISATSSGAVTINGSGSSTGGGGDDGVYLSGSGTKITSGSGGIAISGTGGGLGNGDDGVEIDLGALVTATGTGAVSITGAATQSGYSNNIGVYLHDSGTKASAIDGDLTISGSGGGSGYSGIGVDLQAGATVSSTGAGAVKITGTGAATGATGFDIGVYSNGTGTNIESNNGNITITGSGSGLGQVGIGVYFNNNTLLQSQGTGSIRLVGTGAANAAGDNDGIALQGTGVSVSTMGGNISLTGTGQGTGSENYGVWLFNGPKITATGAGTVSVTGTANASVSGFNYGVYLGGTATAVNTSNGLLTITGTGAGAGGNGVVVSNSAAVKATGTGGIALAGNASAQSATYGVLINGGVVQAGGASTSYDLSLNALSSINVNFTTANGTSSGFEFLKVDGGVSLGGASVVGTVAGPLSASTQYTLIDNTGSNPVNGTFAQNTQLNVNGQLFTIGYAGGSGNDVTATTVSAAPANVVPGTQTTTTSNSLLFSIANSNAIAISDAAIGGGNDKVELTVDHGTLVIAIAYGVTFTGQSTNDLILTGTLSQLNQTLNTLFFQAPNAPAATTLTVTATDLGDSQNAVSHVTVNVVATSAHINQTPTVSAPVGTQSVSNITPLAFSTAGSNGVLVGDLDAGYNSERVTLSVAHGTLHLGSMVGLTFINGTTNGSSTLTFTGRIDQMNYDLQTLTYTARTGFAGSDALSVNINDFGSTGTGGAKTASGSVNINVTSVLANTTPGAQAVVSGHALLFSAANGNALAVTDPNPGGNVQVKLQVNGGVLQIAIAYGAVTFSGNGTTTLTLTGTVADVNNTLSTLAYIAGPLGSYTLTMTSTDPNHNINQSQIAIAVQSATTHVDITPSVFAPSATQNVAHNGTKSFNTAGSNAVSVGDPDSGYDDVQVTLSVSHGTLNVTPLSGSSTPDSNGVRPAPLVQNIGTATLTLTGRLDHINYILQSLVYAATTGYSGPDVLTVQISDLGHNGTGGPKTASGTVNLSVS